MALAGLGQRRAVVKQCSTPCVQDCYLRRDSDSARALALDAARLAGRTIVRPAARLRPSVEHHPDAVLRLELSDVWRGPDLAGARRAVDAAGVPDRALCRDCPMPWSPNLP